MPHRKAKRIKNEIVIDLAPKKPGIAFLELSDDAITLVIECLPIANQLKLERVDKRFKANVRAALRGQKYLALVNQEKGNKAVIRCKKSAHQVPANSYLPRGNSKMIVKFLARLPNLRVFVMHADYDNPTVYTVRMISKALGLHCKQLEHVESDSKRANAMLCEFIHKENITCLDVDNRACRAISRTVMEGCDKLEFASFGFSAWEQELVADTLRENKKLNMINIRFQKEPILTFVNVICEHGQHLKSVTVDMNIPWYLASSLSEVQVKKITSNLKQLENLTLYGPPEILTALSKFQHLKKLTWSHKRTVLTCYSSDVISSLAAIRGLRSLHLECNRVCGTFIKKLVASIPSLVELTIDSRYKECDLQDDTLDTLGFLKQLRYLKIVGKWFSLFGVAKLLSASPKLRYLEVITKVPASTININAIANVYRSKFPKRRFELIYKE